MAKKNLIEEALIEAKELERASIDNAKDIVLESFTPDFVNFFKDVLNESDGEDDEEDDDDEEELDETDHDMGKQEEDDDEDGHDLGKGFSNEGYDYLDEGEYDDVDGDATPESEQYLPSEDKPKVKKTKEGWEDEGYSGKGDPGPENGKSPLPGKKPSVKQTGDGGWEDEGAGTISRAGDPEKGGYNGLDGVPTPKKNVYEEEDPDIEDMVDVDVDVDDDDDEDVNEWSIYEEDEHEEPDDDDEGGESDDDEDDEIEESYYRRSGIFEEEDSEDDDEMETGEEDDDEDDDEDEELDVPEELFKEEDEEDSEDDDDDNLEEEDDVDLDVEDDEESDDDDDEEDEVNENLYIRRDNGRFMKVSLDEYLDNRINTLAEENDNLNETVDFLRGQLQETHLFNAKLAHLNKLVITGAFTNTEKNRIAEKLDECTSIKDVKYLYKTIVSEMQEMNPLDDFSRIIKEGKIQKNSKTENIYESNDVTRMRKLMGYEFDEG